MKIEYTAFPTAKRFHEDKESVVKAIRGPVGGGKTVALCMEILMTAMEQEPDVHELVYPRDGGRAVRPTRFLAVRATYPQLKSTLIKTFNEWTGKLGTIVYDSPIRFHARFPMPDDTIVDLEVLFLALDGPRAAENLRSLEVTGIAISEFSEIGRDILDMALTRIGRYPKRAEAEVAGETVKFGPTRVQVIMESNSPSTRSHWYQLFEVDRPRGYRLYVQPPAMLWDRIEEKWVPNPEAENIENLPGGFKYYENIIAGADPDFINVYVANNYGASFAGKPVFSSFSPMVHVVGQFDPAEAENFRPEGDMLLIGMDFGLNPAAVLGEVGPTGGLRIYDELVDTSVTFEEFLDDGLLPLLRSRYQRRNVLVIGDPAGAQRSALSRQTAMQMLMERGVSCTTAPTNEIEQRIEAVNYFLTRRGMFLMSPDCVTLREALAGGYRFAEVRSKAGVYKDVPEKNEFSHVADALQYLALYVHNGTVQLRRRALRPKQVFGSHGHDNSGEGRRPKFAWT